MNLPLLRNDLYYVILDGLKQRASIGIHDFEREAPQDMSFDVALVLEKGEGTDHISDVVDYDFIRNLITRLTADRHYDLQESLCSDILSACLEQDGVLGALVQTRKTTVYEDTNSVGCRMSSVEKDHIL